MTLNSKAITRGFSILFLFLFTFVSINTTYGQHKYNFYDFTSAHIITANDLNDREQAALEMLKEEIEIHDYTEPTEEITPVTFDIPIEAT